MSAPKDSSLDAVMAERKRCADIALAMAEIAYFMGRKDAEDTARALHRKILEPKS